MCWRKKHKTLRSTPKYCACSSSFRAARSRQCVSARGRVCVRFQQEFLSMEVYRLTPKAPHHESWKRSTVTKQFVKVRAYNCTEARTKAAKATEQTAMEFTPLPAHRYAPIVLPQSPWELPDVTSCEVDG